MKFKSEVSVLYAIIIVAVVALLVYSLVVALGEEESRGVQITLIAVVTVVCGFLTWLMLDTSYTVKEKTIYWKSALIRGTINIDSIKSIEPKKTMLSGLKPATGMKGIIVTYNNDKRIYFSPKRQDEFIALLISENNKIKLIKQ